MLIWGAGWDLGDEFRSSPTLVGYVVALCMVEIAASLAVLGLVTPFGERRLRPVVVVIASMGTLAVTVILGVTLVQMVKLTVQGVSNPILHVHGWHRWFLLAHYAPWPLWPIGLWVCTIAYARRTLRADPGRAGG